LSESKKKNFFNGKKPGKKKENGRKEREVLYGEE